MNAWRDFVKTQLEAGAVPCTVGTVEMVGRHGDLDAEYRAAAEGVALVDRSDRGLSRLTGNDRSRWLHNLVTHHVKDLKAGDGHYAFALNVKGRILFDLNILARQNDFLLDLDIRYISKAKSHFEKYIIMEDVSLEDLTPTHARFGLTGPTAGELLKKLGLAQGPNLAILQATSFHWNGVDLIVFRSDFCGPKGYEILTPAEGAVAFWRACASEATPMGREALEIHRIESGIPASGMELHDDVVPAETNRLTQAVHFNKGCYLGQEVVERMRARQVVARRLMGLRFDGPDPAPPGAVLETADGHAVGSVTSSCHSVALHAPIGMAYVKTAAARPGAELTARWDDGRTQAKLTPLPFLSHDDHA